ncbi:uncharacterized protein LOC110098883 isoform X4 [Dendrobium catenatum]|uniref:uncharacterized protein LOC110098883 isoform X4 n=1 Tax=Dendrobium catenatum TaxID=906689 RepID=UPI00109F1BAD|nr:uncharacterized protein LOC110098883 isoform X4 [Dendrobium catenatum]
METEWKKGEVHNCVINLRENPRRRKAKVRVGCGAGFAGDRPAAALKLLQTVEELDYLVLECLAERTLADRYHLMAAGQKGYDPRILEWMSLILPEAVVKRVCIITNMGAVDPIGAQKEVLDLASSLGISMTVSIAYEVSSTESSDNSITLYQMISLTIFCEGMSTYLGAAPIVQCLERYEPDLIITSRVADAALFLAPMVYELGWDWNDFNQLAQGTLAGHLLECGCQLTGGYFIHPGDIHREISFEQLLDLSLPFAEIGYGGEVYVAKADGSGGVLNLSTCAEQLLYEVWDPSSYITPDVVIDLRDVYFCSLSDDRVCCDGTKPSTIRYPEKLLRLTPSECGWKGWGEISYGGYKCLLRAEAADFLVRSWVDEKYPGIKDSIISYIIGYDSLKAANSSTRISSSEQLMEVRLRMDGLFKLKEQAIHFAQEFMALYTNGPAGGGGISTGHKEEILLLKEQVEREKVLWRTEARRSNVAVIAEGARKASDPLVIPKRNYIRNFTAAPEPAPSGKKIPLYQVAHSRAGDKGNDLNFSIIPHFPGDIVKLRPVITPEWVKGVVSSLLDFSPFSISMASKQRSDKLELVTVEIYEARGINSLNIVVRNVLDGGVNCSRRIDRHGKTVSDLILCQEVVLP